jgi:hypothetical protein
MSPINDARIHHVKFFNCAMAVVACLFGASIDAMEKEVCPPCGPFFTAGRHPSDLIKVVAKLAYPEANEHIFNEYVHNCVANNHADQFVTTTSFDTIEHEIQNSLPIPLAYVNRYSCNVLFEIVQERKDRKNIYEVLCSIPSKIIVCVYTMPTAAIAEQVGDYAYLDINTRVVRGIQQGRPEVVAVNRGFDPNFSYFDGDNGRWTTLLHTVLKNDACAFSVSKILLNWGANPNQRDSDGRHPLDLACDAKYFQLGTTTPKKNLFSLSCTRLLDLMSNDRPVDNSSICLEALTIRDLVHCRADINCVSYERPDRTFAQFISENNVIMQQVPSVEPKKIRDKRMDYLLFVLKQKSLLLLKEKKIEETKNKIEETNLSEYLIDCLVLLAHFR